MQREQRDSFIWEEIFYRIRPDGRSVSVAGYQGKEREVVLPSGVCGYPVKEIEKKAFFGSRELIRIQIPATIEKIGDWAFAGCHSLREAVFLGEPQLLGSRLFQKSEGLKALYLEKGGKQTVPGLAGLLAAAVVILEAEYLLQIGEIESVGWYQRLDQRILELLAESEEAVLKRLVYCAEEDMFAVQEKSIVKREMQKVQVSLLRLSFAAHLSLPVRRVMEQYVCSAAEGKYREAVFAVLREPSAQQHLFCDALLAAGAIKEENLQHFLTALDNDALEGKAYLLSAWQKRHFRLDLWESLQLD